MTCLFIENIINQHIRYDNCCLILEGLIMVEKSHQRNFRLTAEFFLLLILLIALVLLVIVILVSSPGSDSVTPTAKELSDYRSSLLAIVLTAFGAWIGAGAAYFFGRENVKAAYEGMRLLQQPSPLERLRAILVREVPPKPIEWTVTKETPLKTVLEKLKEKPEYWFIPVLGDDGKVETVINEEGIWRFVDHESLEAEKANGDVKSKEIRKQIEDKTVDKVIAYLKESKELDSFKDQFITLELDQSMYNAYEQMDQKNIKLAIVLNAEGKPKYYITTTDLRKTISNLK
jgi:hypothetical protein